MGSEFEGAKRRGLGSAPRYSNISLQCNNLYFGQSLNGILGGCSVIYFAMFCVVAVATMCNPLQHHNEQAAIAHSSAVGNRLCRQLATKAGMFTRQKPDGCQ